MVLLALGIAIMVFSAIGLLIVRNRYDRLHYVAPAATLGMPLIGLAVALDGGFAAATVKVVFIVVLTVLTSPIVSAAMGFVIRREE
ncbi:MAG TPA: monovalent cation/H(+) antiporter subunit G [Salinisphaeraceae bacterium]|nr:monovalent cation/H(+) antiporter subunit G [Salinisphaeraceae bacterium]